MKLRTFYKTGILFLFYLLATNNSHAQKKPSLELGIKLMAEANSYYDSFMPLTGVQLVYQKGKHGGLETGLYYRSQRVSTYYAIYDPNGGLYSGFSKIGVRFLTLPVLYRFRSRIINFTAGPSLDLYVSWKEKSKNKNGVIIDYNRSGNIAIGAVASISKDISLGDKWVLEPEIRFNPVSDEGSYTAFGFALRYKLH